MKTFYFMVFVLFAVMLFGFGEQALSLEIPDPMKETVSYGYTEDKVTVRYTDGAVFNSTIEEMGIREFYVFTKNLSRPKGSPPIILPSKFLVIKTVLKTDGGDINVISTTTGVTTHGTLQEVKAEVTEEKVTGE